MTSISEELSKCKEWRIFGPPGTGKTTYLSEQVRRAAMSRGPEAIVVSSFTKAAAVEISGRGIPVPKDNVGTLHALCFRAIGHPTITESKHLLKEWNQKRAIFGEEIAEESDNDDFNPIERESGVGNVYANYQWHRARMSPVSKWPSRTRSFGARWEKFKKDTNSIDFTDLIEYALRDGIGLPRSAQVGFFDEVQDFSPLELKLVRSWSEQLEQIILAGDDDQSIYHFRGSTPNAFLFPTIPEDHKRILSQSWRLPQKIKSYADRWIRYVEYREEKNFQAKKDGEGKTVIGNIDNLPVGFDQPKEIIREMMRYVDSGKTVMLLASCGYMLEDVIREMRFEGVLFKNDYRSDNLKWNPVSAVVPPIISLLKNDPSVWGEEASLWTWEETWRWLALLDSKNAGIQYGMKKIVEQLASREATKHTMSNWESITSLFDTSTEHGRFTLKHLQERTILSVLKKLLLKKNIPILEYALNVARLNGKSKLREDPKITIGTIHSVKGAQADVVFVSPDLSNSARCAWYDSPGTTREDKDSIIRVFYVAFTRAKERLVLCAPNRRSAKRNQYVEF